jgi:hypothetical protein
VTVVRTAEIADLERLLVIADRRRHEYAGYQPRFWNPAPDALVRQRDYFETLLADPEALFEVAATADRVRGFIAARLLPAPPVYDPGGVTCLVDDFTVDDTEAWSEVGPLLLASARSWAAERDAAQLVVVTAARDHPKRAALSAADLSLASEWWVGAVPSRGPMPARP